MDSASLKAKRINDLIDSLGVDSSSDPALKTSLTKILGGYADETTYDLIEASVVKDNQKSRPDRVFFSSVIMYSTEQEVREAAYYRSLVPEYINLGTLQACLRGLHILGCYEDMKLEELTGTELSIVTALINISIKFIIFDMDEIELGFYRDGDGKPAVLIDNDELGDLIVDHHQQVDSIIRFIEERHSADSAALREYLSDPTAASSLRSGVL